MGLEDTHQLVASLPPPIAYCMLNSEQTASLHASQVALGKPDDEEPSAVEPCCPR